MKNYTLFEVKYIVKEESRRHGSYQIVIREKKSHTDQPLLIEASDLAKNGFAPLNKQHQHYHHFLWESASSVELTFKCSRTSRLIKAHIDLEENVIKFFPFTLKEKQLSSLTHNIGVDLKMPTKEDIQTIMDSIYLGNQNTFLFFTEKKKFK